MAAFQGEFCAVTSKPNGRYIEGGSESQNTERLLYIYTCVLNQVQVSRAASEEGEIT